MAEQGDLFGNISMTMCEIRASFGDKGTDPEEIEAALGRVSEEIDLVTMGMLVTRGEAHDLRIYYDSMFLEWDMRKGMH